MLTNIVSLTFFTVLLVNLVESKPNCQKCLTESANYIDHYKYLNCKPIANKDCPQCIDRFDCSSLPLEVKELDVKQCYVGNKTYSVGETILFKRKFCKYCSCVDVPLQPVGNEEETDANDNEEDEEEETTQNEPVADFNATAILMARKDPPKYNPLPLDNNYEARVTCAQSSMSFNTIINSPSSNEYCFYKESECSGTRHCIPKEKLEKENCMYQGKKYAFGEIIHPEEEDHCLKCKCSSSWTNNISQMVKQCERLSCDLEDSMLFQGCIPIYENKCCPNNYYCPHGEKDKKREPVQSGKCYFDGKNFDIGSKLVVDNPCLECSCKLPPYHTCVTKEKCEE